MAASVSRNRWMSSYLLAPWRCREAVRRRLCLAEETAPLEYGTVCVRLCTSYSSHIPCMYVWTLTCRLWSPERVSNGTINLLFKLVTSALRFWKTPSLFYKNTHNYAIIITNWGWRVNYCAVGNTTTLAVLPAENAFYSLWNVLHGYSDFLFEMLVAVWDAENTNVSHSVNILQMPCSVDSVTSM